MPKPLSSSFYGIPALIFCVSFFFPQNKFLTVCSSSSPWMPYPLSWYIPTHSSFVDTTIFWSTSQWMLVCQESQRILGNPLHLRPQAQSMLSLLSEERLFESDGMVSFSVHHENTLKPLQLKTKARQHTWNEMENRARGAFVQIIHFKVTRQIFGVHLDMHKLKAK